ncbi:MAG: sulfatase-like hydrolase/transferase [Cyanobacteria bacterium P01_C01_bin.72]
MSCIEEATSAFPGNNGRIPFENAFIPAVLNEKGWNTFALGKWHLLPEEEANMAATKRNWPLGRGFERYYGFLGGETDQWYPDLVYDNHLIEPPAKPSMTVAVTKADGSSVDTSNLDGTEDSTQWTYKTEGYHFSEDLTNKAISFIQDTRAIADEKPWMMYFCPGANHAPHQIWPEIILKYGYNTTLGNTKDSQDFSFVDSSVFGTGYEEYRKDILANMRTMGIFDESVENPTEINPHNEFLMDPNYDADHYGADYDSTLDPEKDIIGVPEDKKWPQSDWVRPWSTLEEKEKALFVRMAEIYAAYSSYTDEQIGRLLDYLDKTGELENTIIIAVADNGASAEGGPSGSVNENLFFNDIPDDPDTNLNYLQRLGTDETYNHYPSGWAWGFDTPFKYWKRWSGYEGGAATPFMMCGPGIESNAVVGGCFDGTSLPDCDFRKQYIHAVDVVPTLYEMCGITAPEVVKGYTQNPIEGISFAYTFDQSFAGDDQKYAYKIPTEDRPTDNEGNPIKIRDTQFYSMLGTRGIWYQGWHANAVHPPTPSDWSNFDKDIWELYCMDGVTAEDPDFDTFGELPPDPTQAVNLVDPDYLANSPISDALKTKLEQMKNIWFLQAGLYNGIPLDDRSTAAVLGGERPQLSDPNKIEYTYYPGGSEIPEAVAPNIRTRSYSIEATLQVEAEHDDLEGVLLAHGGRFGGHSFYIHDSKLCYVYNWLGQYEQKVSCPLGTVSGEVKVKIEFGKEKTLDPTIPGADPNLGSSTVGIVKLYIDEVDQALSYDFDDDDSATDFSVYQTAGSERFLTQPAKFALCGEGFNLGRDGGQPVSTDYEDSVPYEFEVEGVTLQQVVVTLGEDAAPVDTDKEFLAMLMRD